jgi:hypothetical protein
MLSTNLNWQDYEISSDQTCHLIGNKPAYSARFLSVLKFHEPGLAPVMGESGAYHINTQGDPAYPHRFMRTFGFYEGRAAVQAMSGWYHICADGSELYPHRFSWCGNYQQRLCVVKDFDGRFFHIDLEGVAVYPNRFRYAGDFREGHAIVQNNQGFHTHINAKGQLSHDKWFLDLDVYHKGFARARDERGWFHIDLQGRDIYAHRYKNIEPFYNGVARVECDLGALYLINEQGERIETLRQQREDEFHQISGELVSYWRFYTILAAQELQLFEHLPNPAEKISELIFIPKISTIKLLRALQELGLVSLNEKGCWLLTAKGEFFNSHHPFSLKNAWTLWKDEHLTAWRHILYSLKTGSPAFDDLYGKNWFEWLKDQPEKNELYHSAISVYAKRDYQAFCNIINMSKHSSVLDVGGSKGTLLIDILELNPHLEGRLLDLPNVVQLVDLPPHLQQRIKVIPADFFDHWPSFTTESAILSRVLHDWDNKDALEILKKVHAVLSNHPTHRLYIIENLLNETSGQGGLLDLNMLVMTGGTERTLEQFKTLLNQAGFVLEATHPLNQVSAILIARKI